MNDLIELFSEEKRKSLRKKLAELEIQISQLGKYPDEERMPITAGELRMILRFYAETVDNLILAAEAIVKLRNINP